MSVLAHPRVHSKMESDKTFIHNPVNTAAQSTYFLELSGAILRHELADARIQAEIFLVFGSFISASNGEQDEMVWRSREVSGREGGREDEEISSAFLLSCIIIIIILPLLIFKSCRRLIEPKCF